MTICGYSFDFWTKRVECEMDLPDGSLAELAIYQSTMARLSASVTISDPISMNSAVLSDREVTDEMVRGNVTINPFVQANLGNCSYDVTLGPNHFVIRHDVFTTETIVNPFNTASLAKLWDCVPKPAFRVETVAEAEALGLVVGSEYIALPAGATILGHTNEFIGGTHNITTMMRARSSMARACISVCSDAGWGDVGYINRWTMQIRNNSPCFMILPVGMRVAQIIFLRTGPVNKFYGETGHYQTHSGLDILMANWSPADMLPRGIVGSFTEVKIAKDVDSPSVECLPDDHGNK